MAGGVKIRFDFSFFAAVGIFLAFDKAGYGIYCLAACFCHELGHLAVMLAEGKLPDEIIILIKLGRKISGECVKKTEKEGKNCLKSQYAALCLFFYCFWHRLKKSEETEK